MSVERERIKEAPDGVQEVALTDARPLLTKLIEDAREQGKVSALTVRGRRKIALVTPEWYERARTALGEPSPQGDTEETT